MTAVRFCFLNQSSAQSLLCCLLEAVSIKQWIEALADFRYRLYIPFPLNLSELEFRWRCVCVCNRLRLMQCGRQLLEVLSSHLYSLPLLNELIHRENA